MGAVAGQPFVLFLDFFDEDTGNPADPSAVELDITYGGEFGLVADVAGPFTYQGSAVPVAGQVWRIAQGQFACIWPVPADVTSGVYTANWPLTYGTSSLVPVENFYVAGGFRPAVPQGDTGYWTGSIAWTPAAGDLTNYTGQSVQFGEVDANGIAWLLNKVEGWDGCDIQGAGLIPRSGDHGAWAPPQFYAARALTLTVTAMAPTQALRDTARSVLQQSVPVSSLAAFVYDEPVPKTAMVRRSGKIAETYPDLQSVQFVIGLIAPDPRKYATPAKTTGRVSPLPLTALGFTLPFTLPVSSPGQVPGGAAAVTNAGDFETRPVITIRGPVTAPSLSNVQTGQMVSWSDLVMGASDRMVVDFNARTALLNGAYRPADLSSSWWVLPPGTTTVQFGGQSDTGSSFTCVWSDAWQ